MGKDDPLRTIRMVVNAALAGLSDEFSALYAQRGRPSILPEKLLRAMLLQAFYSIRSERQLMERLEFDLLFRWFVGIGVDDAVWDHSTFSKNRDRLLEGAIAAKLLSAVLAQPRVKWLLSTELPRSRLDESSAQTPLLSWRYGPSTGFTVGRPALRGNHPCPFLPLHFGWELTSAIATLPKPYASASAIGGWAFILGPL